MVANVRIGGATAADIGSATAADIGGATAAEAVLDIGGATAAEIGGAAAQDIGGATTAEIGDETTDIGTETAPVGGLTVAIMAPPATALSVTSERFGTARCSPTYQRPSAERTIGVAGPPSERVPRAENPRFTASAAALSVSTGAFATGVKVIYLCNKPLTRGRLHWPAYKLGVGGQGAPRAQGPALNICGIHH